MLVINDKEIFNFLDNQKEILLAIYNEKGVLGLCGHNGPYMDKETGVRAQSHLIILLSNLDRVGKNRIYESKVNEIISSIFTSSFRLDQIVFVQRVKPGKDEVNGVIGIAWVIEALCAAYEVYKNNEAKAFLEKVEDNICFNSDRGLWYRPVDLNSKYINTIDETFNHQLWLAYALVYKCTVLEQPLSANLQNFFKRLNGLMNVYRSGLVKHSLQNKSTVKQFLRNILKINKDRLSALIEGKSLKYKEYGYHLFNLYAFARIADLGHSTLFSHIPGFIKAKKYCLNTKLLKELLTNRDSTDFYIRGNNSGMPYNRYGFPYNVAGFEFLYINEVLGLGANKSVLKEYFENQLNCYGISANKMYITEDLSNLLLRSYELSFILI